MFFLATAFTPPRRPVRPSIVACCWEFAWPGRWNGTRVREQPRCFDDNGADRRHHRLGDRPGMMSFWSSGVFAARWPATAGAFRASGRAADCCRRLFGLRHLASIVPFELLDDLGEFQAISRILSHSAGNIVLGLRASRFDGRVGHSACSLRWERLGRRLGRLNAWPKNRRVLQSERWRGARRWPAASRC